MLTHMMTQNRLPARRLPFDVAQESDAGHLSRDATKLGGRFWVTMWVNFSVTWYNTRHIPQTRKCCLAKSGSIDTLVVYFH